MQYTYLLIRIIRVFCFRNYNGPQKTTPEHKTSSQRNYSKGPYSPAYDYDDDSKYIIDRGRSKMTYDRDADDSEQVSNQPNSLPTYLYRLTYLGF